MWFALRLMFSSRLELGLDLEALCVFWRAVSAAPLACLITYEYVIYSVNRVVGLEGFYPTAGYDVNTSLSNLGGDSRRIFRQYNYDVWAKR